MTKKEIYKNYPLISTARDLNNERGIYLTIPYSFPSSSSVFYPLIRFTKSGTYCIAPTAITNQSMSRLE